LKKSHQTALGMASIFSIHFCSNILQHLRMPLAFD